MRHPVRSSNYRIWGIVKLPWSNGRLPCRWGGPAIEFDNGTKQWFDEGDLMFTQSGTGWTAHSSAAWTMMAIGDEANQERSVKSGRRDVSFLGYKLDDSKKKEEPHR